MEKHEGATEGEANPALAKPLKPTPGSWFFDGKLRDGKAFVSYGAPENYNPICEVGWKFGIQTDEQKIANAYLIAAAPSLMKACWDALAALRSESRQSCYDVGGAALHQRLKAAIEAARPGIKA